jgi:hypothetical protein
MNATRSWSLTDLDFAFSERYEDRSADGRRRASRGTKARSPVGMGSLGDFRKTPRPGSHATRGFGNRSGAGGGVSKAPDSE